MPADDVEIRERLVRIEVLLGELHHDLKGYKMALQAYVPRPEIELAMSSMGARLNKLETAKDRLVWWLFGAWLAGLAFAAEAVWRKLFA